MIIDRANTILSWVIVALALSIIVLSVAQELYDGLFVTGIGALILGIMLVIHDYRKRKAERAQVTLHRQD